MENRSLKIYAFILLAILALTSAACVTGGILQTIAAVFISACFGIITTKYHYLYILPAALITIAEMALFGGIIPALIFGVPVILTGLALGISSNVKLSVYKTILICAALYLLQSAFALRISGMFAGNVSYYSMYLRETGEAVAAIMKEQYGMTGEMAQYIDSTVREIMSLSFTLTPAIFIVFSLVIGTLTVFVYKKIQQKLKNDVNNFVPFVYFRADRVICIIYIVLIILITAAQPGMFFDMTLNVVVVLSIILYFFGLAFADRLLLVKGLSKSARGVLIFVVLPLLSVVFFLPVAVLIGFALADGIFNVKIKIRNKEENNGSE